MLCTAELESEPKQPQPQQQQQHQQEEAADEEEWQPPDLFGEGEGIVTGITPAAAGASALFPCSCCRCAVPVQFITFQQMAGY
jgi:hypothetical protein